jgi:hypothetical protein
MISKNKHLSDLLFYIIYISIGCSNILEALLQNCWGIIFVLIIYFWRKYLLDFAFVPFCLQVSKLSWKQLFLMIISYYT